jgi:hypothetical protein
MSSNTSQDPEYVGPTGHEKKFHKTHFEGAGGKIKTTHPKDDPNWEYVSAGRWRWVGKRSKYGKRVRRN